MSDHSWKVKRCGLPCCKPIDFLSGQEVLHIGHIEQGVSIPCSMWPIRPVSVRWRYRNRRMERRGMGAAWAAWAAWATARPISRRGAIGAIGGRRRRFFWRPSAIEVLGGGARVRILPHGRAQAVSRPGRRPIGSWRLRSAWQIAAEKPLRRHFPAIFGGFGY